MALHGTLNHRNSRELIETSTTRPRYTRACVARNVDDEDVQNGLPRANIFDAPRSLVVARLESFSYEQRFAERHL